MQSVSGTNMGFALAGLAVVGFIAMFVAWKVGKWIAKVTLFFILLLIGAGAVWWFFLRPQ